VVQKVGPRTQAEPLLVSWPCIRDTLDAGAQSLLNVQSEAPTVTLKAMQSAVTAHLAGECPAR
jgi:hypothetical protein